MKANFEFEENWDIHAKPLDQQKLDEIKKQKPEDDKKRKEREKFLLMLWGNNRSTR